MMDEIGVIAGYPLRDVTSFVLLSLFIGFLGLVPWFLGLVPWFFGLVPGVVGIIAVAAKGVLTWYSFNAVSKVSIGNMRDLRPGFRVLSELAQTIRLSLAALVISAGPFFLCMFLIPGASELTGGRSYVQGLPSPPPAPAAAEENGSHNPFDANREGGSILGPIAMLGIVMAVIWMVAYMPVALTVAALSKSIVSTLSPTIGIDTIKKMGGVYGQALAIYLAIVVAQTVAGYVLGFIPAVGGLAVAFVDAYAAFAIGCTLGLALFKRAAEPGRD